MSLPQFVRELPPFVRFVSLASVMIAAIHLVFFGDYRLAVLALYGGITIGAFGGYTAPVVSRAIFSRAHERAEVPSPCGDPTEPTAGDWHRAIVVPLGGYVVIVGSTALMRQELTGSILLSGVTFMLPWLAILLLTLLIADGFHFLAHRREYRRELEERHTQEITRKFWDQVHGHHRPDPGPVA